jgi:prophage tail gpP-like protein
MMEVELSNIRYRGFSGVSVTRDIENLCATFSIDATTLERGNFPIKRGEACKIYIDDEKILTGYVDTIDIAYTSDSHGITVTGRDKTEDIVDSTVDAKVEIKTPITLEGLITKILAYLNSTDIKIINQVGSLASFSAADIVSGKIGETAVAFLHDFCAKRQVLLTSNEDGDLVITRGEGVSVPAALIHKINGFGVNNVKGARVTYDDTKRFNRYILRAQPAIAGVSNLDSDTPLIMTSGFKGESIDSTVRASRVITLNAEKITNVSECTNRAQWERDIHRARAINYTATVYGHRHGGNFGSLWKPLQLVNVVDEYCGINDILIIRTTKFNNNLTEGDLTELSLVPKDTYKLLENEEKKSKKKKDGAPSQADIKEILSYSTK